MEFLKTKKAKAMVGGAIITGVSAAIIHFFPGSADTVAEWLDFLAEIATGVSDKVTPESIEVVAE